METWIRDFFKRALEAGQRLEPLTYFEIYRLGLLGSPETYASGERGATAAVRDSGARADEAPHTE